MDEGGSHSTSWRYKVSVLNDQPADYLFFTDDLSLTSTPIKYSQPPYTNAAPTQVILPGNFESAAPGAYSAGQIVNGWTVLSNEVAVIADANLAYDGVNALALSSGQITRTLPTIAGSRYELDFSTRG